MSQKKEGQDENKPGVKIQDLAPSKDAKGGAARGTDGGMNTNAGGMGTNAGMGANAGGGDLNSGRDQNSLRNAGGAKGGN